MLEPRPVLGKRGALLDGSHQQPPADVRPHVDIGGGEALARDPAVAGHGVLQGIHHRFVRAVADHRLLVGGRLEAQEPVGRRRLQRSCREEEPPVVGAALTGRGSEARVREGVGEVGADRGRLGDDRVAVADGRHLAHGIDRKVGIGLHHRTVFDDLGAIARSGLLQHPAGDASPRHGVGVENKLVGHRPLPMVSWCRSWTRPPCRSAPRSRNPPSFKCVGYDNEKFIAVRSLGTGTPPRACPVPELRLRTCGGAVRRTAFTRLRPCPCSTRPHLPSWSPPARSGRGWSS